MRENKNFDEILGNYELDKAYRKLLSLQTSDVDTSPNAYERRPEITRKFDKDPSLTTTESYQSF